MRADGDTRFIRYNQRLIAFIDILGWRSLVEEIGRSEQRFNGVFKASDQLIDLQELRGDLPDAQVTHFSDTLVWSCLDVAESYYPLMWIICNVVERLFGLGVLCRGGITTGFLYHDSDHVFGPALVDACLMESERANSPRILISKHVVNELRRPGAIDHCPVGLSSWTDYVRTDRDGLFFLDTVSALFRMPGAFDDEQARLEALRSHQAVVEQAKQRAPSGARVLEKWTWYLGYINALIEEMLTEDVDS